MYLGTCVKMKDYKDAKKNEACLCVMTQSFNNISLNMVKRKLQKWMRFSPILEKKIQINTLLFIGQAKWLEK